MKAENFFDLNINEIDYVVKRSYKQNNKYPIKHKSSFRLVYILQGVADFIFENHLVQTKGGDILFLSPSNDHLVKVGEKEEYSFITLSFTCNLAINEPVFSCNSPSSKKHFLEIYKLFNEKKTGWTFNVKSLVYQILFDFVKSNSFFKKKQSKIQNVLDFINEHYTEKITLTTLSNISGYSLSHFKRVFMEEMRVSPMRYVNMLRIKKAKYLLKSKMFTITEVSELCGFEDIYYFSNAFKKETGTSPKNFD